jgi:signal transduction histidine kinase
MVHRQLAQINRLVGDLHLLSMARANKLMLEFSDILINDLVDERLAWVAQPLQNAEIKVLVGIPKQLTVSADRDRIGQVLSILIDNVLRYAASGKSLSIEASASINDVTISICDRGPGVALEQLPRMIDRFWRADDSRARHSGGSGLGLAIASAICQAHGGSLEFTRRVGGGLCARIQLPISGESSNR